MTLTGIFLAFFVAQSSKSAACLRGTHSQAFGLAQAGDSAGFSRNAGCATIVPSRRHCMFVKYPGGVRMVERHSGTEHAVGHEGFRAH